MLCSEQLPLAIVQYSFLHGKRLPISLNSHGNSKRSTQEYIRTAQSTLQEIKSNMKKMTPKEAVKTVYEKAGGAVSANSFGELPRDRRQAINLKSNIWDQF